MKYLYLVLISIFSFSGQLCAQEIVETAYFAENPELGGDVIIQKAVRSIEKNSTTVTFFIKADSSGEYYANFWLCPAETNDGSFYYHKVLVDGKIVGTIKPTKGGWQSAGLAGDKKITLMPGEHTISVIGNPPIFANVEHVRLSTSLQKAMISSAMYDEYINMINQSLADSKGKMFASTDLIDNNDSFVQTRSSNVARISPPSIYDKYYYTYEENLTASYTYYTTLSLTQGQQISLNTSGDEGFRHVLYCFNAENPDLYSWATRSGTSPSTASLNLTIPQSGLYYLLVRANNNSHGYCNLNINNEYFYPSVPVSNTRAVCNIDTLWTYNIFTVKSQGNPRIWVEEENSIFSYGRICSYNDNYIGNGDYDWGTNARIKQHFTRPVQAVLVSHYGAYSPISQLDLYMGCRNYGITNTSNTHFPNYKEDDAIKSAYQWDRYNCYAWSLGITDHKENPLFITSSYHVSNNPLASFDNMYATRGLTRTGANESNAVVALWAVDSMGVKSYKHASVRGADGNMHGYDWESKLGETARVFHPRDALAGPLYGQIAEYYTKDPNSLASTMCLEDEIAEGISQIEYVNFDEFETQIIADHISRINVSVREHFLELYEIWKLVTRESLYSSTMELTKYKEYSDALVYCKQHPELRYMLYQLLDKGDWKSEQLIVDLIMTDSAKVALKRVLKELDSHSTIKTYRSPESNLIAYIKTIIGHTDGLMAKTHSLQTGISGVSHSNCDEFYLLPKSNGLNVSFQLTSDSFVSLKVLDLSGREIAQVLDEQKLCGGKYSYDLNLNHNGVVLVKLVINGHINVKKYLLKIKNL